MPKPNRFLAVAVLHTMLIFLSPAAGYGQAGPVIGEDRSTTPGSGFPLDKALITTKPLIGGSDSIIPKGRIELFNGQDFTGWSFYMRNDADPLKTWNITNGLMHCNGADVGYLRTKESFRDYHLTVEWRFVKMALKADNTGVLVHIQPPDKIWPQCVQVQGKHERQGDLFLMAGAQSKEHHGIDANTALPMRGESAEKAIGEWNTCETVCAGNSVKAYINGKLLNETTECTVTNGAIGIQSEGAEFEIRKILIEPLN